jgi:hypothetical protein
MSSCDGDAAIPLQAELTMDDTRPDVTDLTQLDDGADPDVE